MNRLRSGTETDKQLPNYWRRRAVAAGVAALALIGAGHTIAGNFDSESSSADQKHLAYPQRPTQEYQEEGWPKTTVTAETGDTARTLIEKVDPGLTSSEVPGSQKLVGQLTEIIEDQAPNGIVQDGGKYQVPAVPTQVVPGK